MTYDAGRGQSRIRPEWLRVAVAVAAGSVVLALLLLPSVAFGVTTDYARADAHAQQYKLGEVVKTTGTIGLALDEGANIQDVSFEVIGPQPLNAVSLPVTDSKPLTNLSSLLPQDAGQPRGTLKLDVSSVDVFRGSLGFGYGYGYIGLSSLAKITYTIRYTPPVLLVPAPPALPGAFQSPSPAFPVPGGAAGGGEGGPLELSLLYEIPGVPGAPPGSLPLDIARMPYSLLILVDGPSGQNDVIIETDLFSPYVYSFQDTGQAQTTAIAVDSSGFRWYAYKSGTNWFVYNIDTDQTVPVVQGANKPTGDLKSAFWDGFVNRLVLAEFQSDPTKSVKIWEIDPLADSGDGAVVNTFTVPAGPTSGGYTGLELNKFGSPPPYLGGFGSAIAQFEPGTGFIIDTTDIVRTDDPDTDLDMAGMALVPGYDPNDPSQAQLFVADATTKAIFAGPIVEAGTAASNLPRAIASHTPDKAFVLVEPDDIHYVQAAGPTAGQTLLSFSAPSGDVESLAFVPGSPSYLFAVDNGGSSKVLYRAQVTTNSLPVIGSWVSFKTLPAFVGDIGGMAYGDAKLYLAEQWSDTVHVVDPATGNVSNSLGVFVPSGNPMLFTMGGLDALAYVPASKSPTGQGVLVGGRGNIFLRINPQPGPDGGKVLGLDFTNPGLPPYTIQGLTTDQSGIILAADRDTVQVYRTVIPGTPPQDPTAVGDYTARFSVTTANPGTIVKSTDFTLQKVTDLGLAITAVDGTSVVGLTAIGVASPSIVIHGTIGDPTVTQVGITADLAETTLVGQKQADGSLAGPSTFSTELDRAQYDPNVGSAGPGNLWHFTNTILGVLAGNMVAYFGKDDTSNPNYCNPDCTVPDFAQQPSAGDFRTSLITLGANAALSFKTWYDTEPMPDFDQKLVQWCPTSGSCQTLAQVVDPFTVPPSPGDPFFNPAAVVPGTVIPKPSFMTFLATQKFILIPNSLFEGGQAKLTQVNLDIAGLSGQTGRFVFRFDSKDQWGNFFKGWVVDDVEVKGAGSLLLAPATVDPEALTWSLPTTIQEGENTLTVTANRTLYDPAQGQAQVTVFLDTVAPVIDSIVLKNATTSEAIVSGVTNNPQVTIEGSFTESTPQVLEVIVNDKTVLKKTSFSSTFSTNATIAAGANTVKVLLKDQAGQCNTNPATACTAATVLAKDTKTLTLDQTAPTVVLGPPAYPVGFVSARGGKDDFVVFQVTASDASGIASVKAASPQTPSAFDISFRSDIPAVVKNQWGVTAPWLLPFKPSSSVFPGTLSLNVQVTDNAGNTATTTVTAEITASLEGFVFKLLPGQNFLSLPILPSGDGTFSSAALEANISSMVSGVASPVDSQQAIESILYYDAASTGLAPEDRWSIWTAATGDTDSLAKLKTGRGYLFQMREDAFGAPTSLGTGLPSAPTPILFTYEGRFLLEGKAVPPTYTVEGTGGAWNMLGFHSQDPLPVTTYLQSLESPQRIWASTLEYRNFISFPLQQGATPEVVLGAFARLLGSDQFSLGRGFWLFALDDGVIVP